jgi:hypothetical protein
MASNIGPRRTAGSSAVIAEFYWSTSRPGSRGSLRAWMTADQACISFSSPSRMERSKPDSRLERSKSRSGDYILWLLVKSREDRLLERSNAIALSERSK